MFTYADQVKRESIIKTDICIVGAGAAGITQALALKDSKIKICILESGDLKPEAKAQSLNELETTALSLSEPSRVRQFGGSTTAWAGRWRPHDPIDFENRPWISNSGWPIDFESLKPYYHQVAKLLDTPDLPSYELGNLDNLVNKSSLPMLQDEVFKTSVFNWLAEKDWDWGKKYAEVIGQSNVEVFLKANVTNLYLSDNGSVIDKAEVKTLAGNSFSVKAKFFVLACGGIENARLLLMSNKQRKAGLGNEHDLVGRYYMDHPKGIVGEIKPSRKELYLPAYWGVTEGFKQMRAGLHLSRKTQEENQILNSYVLLEPVFPWSYNPGISAAVALAKAIKRRDIPSDIVKQHVGNLVRNQHILFRWLTSKVWQRAFKKQARVSKITVWNFMEQEPRPDNRVTLSKELDALGSPRVKLNWSIGELDKKTMVIFHGLLKKHLNKWGVGELYSPLLEGDLAEWPITNDASHHMGTTRMGIDPRRSVVDADCKVHGVENLFIAGSSVFPTSGYTNPTFTICALAARLADFLKQQHVK